jgi:threonine synthase
VQTLASAMDVGDPSNMERLRSIIGDAALLRDCLGVLSVDDDAIRAGIRQDFSDFGFATCPHTATATHTWRQLDPSMRSAHDWILVATAHPAKFETIVEPLIGETVPLPEELAEILSRPSRAVSIEPDLDAVAAAMDEHFP